MILHKIGLKNVSTLGEHYNLDFQLPNPCDAPMLKKLFRAVKLGHWQIHEKETIDEIIFRTTKVRNRLMLELMARSGMRGWVRF